MTDAATASSRTMKGRNMVVVFFSRAGENYEVGEVTVGNTAKLAQEVARAARSRSDRTIFSWGQATPRATARAGSHSSE